MLWLCWSELFALSSRRLEGLSVWAIFGSVSILYAVRPWLCLGGDMAGWGRSFSDIPPLAGMTWLERRTVEEARLLMCSIKS